MIYDVVIIGAGPAGFSAALYLARRKLKTIIITKEVGGQTIWAGNVENYLGFKSLSGLELIQKFQEHLKDYQVEIFNNEEVEKLEKLKQGFATYTTNDKKVTSKSIVLTAGQTPRRLKIPGEKELEKKGVAFCATCDAPLFSKKDVAVIGGGNAALDAILQLEKYARKIYAININPDFVGEKTRMDKVKKSAKVEILFETETKKISGKNFVESIEVENKKSPPGPRPEGVGAKKRRVIPVSGVFIEIGQLPATAFLTNLLKLNEKGEIIIDKKNRTSVPGIFAAGDITDVPYKQIIIAAGEGAKAALSCAEYLTTYFRAL